MQKGQIVKISNRWYLRYREHRNVNGTVEQKRVSHCLGAVTTRGKHPPADIKSEAERHMATINGGKIPGERITTIGDFVRTCTCLGSRSTSARARRGDTATSGSTIWSRFALACG